MNDSQDENRYHMKECLGKNLQWKNIKNKFSELSPKLPLFIMSLNTDSPHTNNPFIIPKKAFQFLLMKSFSANRDSRGPHF